MAYGSTQRSTALQPAGRWSEGAGLSGGPEHLPSCETEAVSAQTIRQGRRSKPITPAEAADEDMH
eukprot:362077-Chlamydomonas_euryale.AAC.5